MILWNIRHEGSPQSVDGVTADDILDGVREGLWETSDEVMGPDDADWTPLERHPVFAQAMADYEPPPPKHPDDETRLDMNPLIDVALVLLIFFMLTTTYEELRKEFNPPGDIQPNPQGKSVTDTELRKSSVMVAVQMEGDQVVYRVEDEVVAEDNLEERFKDLVASSGRTDLAMEVDPEVPWKAFVKVQDAAAGAKFQQVIRIVRAKR
ncbi:MAG TPA: biopolymer transporter ExbD [Gemmataceae bacterium]|jgi:biopolymer transport protein ExbD|nr:biopolymer transporter ExbD [Gemmataceae bacterium]